MRGISSANVQAGLEKLHKDRVEEISTNSKK